jgi:hypothetical protein
VGSTLSKGSSHLENFTGRGIFEIVFGQLIACGHLAPFLEVLITAASSAASQ